MSKMFNRAKMTITSTGTGALTLGSAPIGYQTFASSGVADGDTVSYTIEDGANWEVGTGVYTAAGTTLSRTVTQSYNGSVYGTSPISVTTAAIVFITALAADLSLNGLPGGPLNVANGGTGLASLTAGYIPYGNGTGAFGNSANLTFDGSSLNVSGTSNTPFRQLVVRNLSNGSGAYSVFNIGNDTFLAAMDIAVLSSTNTNFGGASSGLIQSNIGNMWLGTGGAYSVLFATNGSEKMRITSAGNVGIGTTPSAWLSSLRAMQVLSASVASTNATTVFGSNVYYDSAAAQRYITTNYAGSLVYNASGTGGWAFNIAGSGTAGSLITMTTAMTLDANGNLGLGVTPSAWTSWKAIQLAGNTSLYSSSSLFGGIAQNYYYNGNNIYISNGYATDYYQYNGQHVWRTAASGVAGNIATFTQAMTLDASGNLLLGTTSTGGSFKADIQIASSTANYGLQIRSYDAGAGDGQTTAKAIRTVNNSGGNWANAQYDAWAHIFTNAGTECARIDASGNLLVGTTSAVASERLNVTGSVGNYIIRASNSNSSPYGLVFDYTVASPNGTGNAFLRMSDSVLRFEVRSNGGIANYQGNDVNLSDQRLKKDISNANSYLDKICAIPVRTFKYKDQTHDDLNLGVIAQEVEAIAPELVDNDGFGDTPDDGVPYKSIYQTDLQYALMKSIQELAAKVSALEAKQ